ncbi:MULTISPECIES: Rieske (2Fe-2S) protein [Prochlorococcus]|uniref:Rieske 2Fe-2S family protein n=1 Tax=Prochlorococcus marinus (strain SARG / CCMP1375 / SS120) TaxID=167539 RepID=Q7VC52_PROMA|nr:MULTISPECIES: Rieske (2Fe-2S) protein [Prochlorococcus]AAP99934.1 Rieske 2Fe-2S family protein [Prochlorococcus marinus subsp. marinus str. CCMP1375]KGG11720.1 Chlorophyll a [Prochlorococcus marinus str. LG]KGG18867.1 Chlorophyll a [Prochlorococcus marinus str. SS2]KGG23595.1 Chlorophyll a [Prochlorococcus marinus str. SS35]KGG32169.1 Chlorophyll a [Prochlorococcus marinus str. SS51]
MKDEVLAQLNDLKIGKDTSITSNSHNENSRKKESHAKAKEPSNQLKNGLLGWYAVCSKRELKEDTPYCLTMFNEPLVIYRDKESNLRCVKDLCPHRGASFIGGEVIDGELVCPYHGARFSSNGECTNLNRITCNHIVDDNYNNYASKIHLYQYICKEIGDYIYIYYTGNAKTSLKDFEVTDQLETRFVESYGFDISDYAYEEVIVDFKCDWARIVENHIDILHLFWVHGETIPDNDVNRKVITSFNQEITREKNQIESKYKYKDKGNKEFIRIKFLPPGRVVIYKGDPSDSRYIQILDHIPLSNNQARVIVRHYRKFMKNKFITELLLFKKLQHRVFYKVFAEDYMILRTQTYNNQMGFVEKDNIKLLGEDKMVQYYWDWFKSSNIKDNPWELFPTNTDTNTVHQDIAMLYPPANNTRVKENSRSLFINILIRILIPIGFLVVLI